MLTYSLVPFFIKRASATLLNISNLTTAVWSMIIDMALFGESFKWLYIVAFLFETFAILLYSKKQAIQREYRDEIGD